MNTDNLKHLLQRVTGDIKRNFFHASNENLSLLLNLLISDQTPDKPIVVPLEEPKDSGGKGNAAESAGGECCAEWKNRWSSVRLFELNFCPSCGADKRERKECHENESPNNPKSSHSTKARQSDTVTIAVSHAASTATKTGVSTTAANTDASSHQDDAQISKGGDETKCETIPSTQQCERSQNESSNSNAAPSGPIPNEPQTASGGINLLEGPQISVASIHIASKLFWNWMGTPGVPSEGFVPCVARAIDSATSALKERVRELTNTELFLRGQVQGVIAQRDTVCKEREALKEENARCLGEAEEARMLLSTATRENDRLKASLASMTADRDERAEQKSKWPGLYKGVENERNTLRQQIKEVTRRWTEACEQRDCEFNEKQDLKLKLEEAKRQLAFEKDASSKGDAARHQVNGMEMELSEVKEQLDRSGRQAAAVNSKLVEMASMLADIIGNNLEELKCSLKKRGLDPEKTTAEVSEMVHTFLDRHDSDAGKGYVKREVLERVLKGALYYGSVDISRGPADNEWVKWQEDLTAAQAELESTK